VVRYTIKNIPFERKIKAVMTYLEKRESLRKTAHSFGISYMALWNWVRKYKMRGPEALKINKVLYRKSKKRLPKNIEEQIMLLKEQNPSLTVEKAKRLMGQAGIQISNKGIWNVWKRYGFTKRPSKNPLNPFGISTPESDDGIRRAKKFVQDGNLKTAARVLNNIPCLPEDPVVKKIPEKFLSLRRKLDCLYLDLGEIPYPEYHKKSRRVGEELEKQGYVYSSIIANFLELTVLDWMKKTREQKFVLRILTKKMNKVKESSFRFLYNVHLALFYAYRLQFNKALPILKECRRYVSRLPYPYYWSTFGALLTTFGHYKEALQFFNKASEKEEDTEDYEPYVISAALHGHCMAGEYSSAHKMLNKVSSTKKSPGSGSLFYLTRAYISFGQNKHDDASEFFLESLKKATINQLYNVLYATSVGLASVASAVKKDEETKTYLQKYLPLMKKQRLAGLELILRCLAGSVKSVPHGLTRIPPFCLLNLLLQANHTMKIIDYRKAYNYAEKNGLLGFFHRGVVFFPKPVLHMIEKGKSTGLPKSILEFPIFNQKVSVYHIKYLGKLIIYKNQTYLRAQLAPKEKALLIHLALRSGMPGKFILLEDLYQNFWPNNENPSSLLLHTLANLKKKLRLSSHLLRTSSRNSVPKLLNNGVNITTDYDDFEALLTQAKSLKTVGEWRFAEREYARAFRVFRGEPFVRMYDNWSENIRRVVLNQLEAAAIDFINIYSEHKHAYPSRFLVTAKRELENIHRIIPHSKEVRQFLQMC